MKTKIKNSMLSPILLLCALILSVSGCSGGNAGSSSGSGGADPTTTDTTDETSAIEAGEYIGNINFSTINDSAPINIEVETTDSVIVTSNDTGSATGSVTDSSFTASGNLSFILATQTCSGFATVTGSGSANTLTGTVSVSSASCVEGGVTSTISLDGTFSASQ